MVLGLLILKMEINIEARYLKINLIIWDIFIIKNLMAIKQDNSPTVNAKVNQYKEMIIKKYKNKLSNNILT